jgi:hypothetical protein
MDARDVFKRRLDWHRQQYVKLTPLLHLFEPEVVAALVAVDSDPIFMMMDELPYQYEGIFTWNKGAKTEPNLGGYYKVIFSYMQMCEALRLALVASKYIDKQPGDGMSQMVLHQLNWDSLHAPPRQALGGVPAPEC